MNIYFIRHGESTENKEAIYDWMKSPLTDLGVEQSKLVSKRLQNLKFDLIYHSDMVRAKMTALEINKFQNTKLVESTLIREQLPPSELLGLNENDESSKIIMNSIREHVHDLDWHYSDEENFTDFKKRVFKFFNELEDLEQENILVIGHGFVLRALVGYVIYGSNFSSYDFVNLKKSMKTINTGVTICEIKDKKWTLITWNDYSHLVDK